MADGFWVAAREPHPLNLLTTLTVAIFDSGS
jgi:hypothetical protein